MEDLDLRPQVINSIKTCDADCVLPWNAAWNHFSLIIPLHGYNAFSRAAREASRGLLRMAADASMLLLVIGADDVSMHLVMLLAASSAGEVQNSQS